MTLFHVIFLSCAHSMVAFHEPQQNSPCRMPERKPHIEERRTVEQNIASGMKHVATVPALASCEVGPTSSGKESAIIKPRLSAQSGASDRADRETHREL